MTLFPSVIAFFFPILIVSGLIFIGTVTPYFWKIKPIFNIKVLLLFDKL